MGGPLNQISLYFLYFFCEFCAQDISLKEKETVIVVLVARSLNTHGKLFIAKASWYYAFNELDVLLVIIFLSWLLLLGLLTKNELTICAALRLLVIL